MMNNNEHYDLGDLAFRFSCSINALKAIHCAMVEGPNAPENYMGGLFAVRLQLDALADELNAIADGGEGTA